MPLIKGAKPGSKGFKENIKEEAKKRPIKQAVAIAYSESGEKKKKSKKYNATLSCSSESDSLLALLVP